MEESEPRLAREEQQCDAACSIGKLPGRDSREVKPGCFDSSDRCSEVVLLVVLDYAVISVLVLPQESCCCDTDAKERVIKCPHAFRDNRITWYRRIGTTSLYFL
jgi:hypothetical protein